MTSLWLDRPREQVSDPLLPEARLEHLVVGAGLTGLTTALLFARAGRRVAVVDAGEVGALTTGHTTAKLTLLQGTKLSRIARSHGKDVVAAYLEANREGQQWLRQFCEHHGVPVQHRDAITYADAEEDVRKVRQEHDLAAELGLPVTWTDQLPLPFPVHGATVLPDQLQFDPSDVVAALQAELRSHGGTVHPHQRVVGVSVDDGEARVELEDGEVLRAGQVVLATGTPILDRGLSFAQLEAQRSYLLALADLDPPQGMYINAGSPTRSLREVPVDGESLLLVGGSGHAVGRIHSEEKHLQDLRDWAERWFPEGEETHAWSAQDYRPAGNVPHVAVLPGTDGRVHVASGFDKWGMANSVAAALRIAGETLGKRPSWAEPLVHPHLDPRDALGLVKLNLRVGLAEVKSAASVLCRRQPAFKTCTHLGGTLHWNDAEGSWDCPLHGSRFDGDGSVIEGPAVRPLKG